jgi:hypothetical protein
MFALQSFTTVRQLHVISPFLSWEQVCCIPDRELVVRFTQL